MTWTAFVILPASGALIGWATNWLAIRMLFHPRRRILGFQGLIPRRQAQLARDIARTVADQVLRSDDLLKGLDDIDLEPHIAMLLDRAIEAKTSGMRRVPVLGGLVPDAAIARLRASVLREMVAAQPELRAALKRAVLARLDVATAAEANLAAFDLDRLEGLVRGIAGRELRAIEWWGAVLGGLIGLAQAALLGIAG